MVVIAIVLMLLVLYILKDTIAEALVMLAAFSVIFFSCSKGGQAYRECIHWLEEALKSVQYVDRLHQ
jgi:hypothetical protein